MVDAVERNDRDTKRDKPVHCRTGEQRIRSGGKSEGCTTREANAAAPRNPSEMLRGTSLPAVKQEYRRPPSQAHEMLRAKLGAHSVTAPKPFLCSNRDSDWTDRRAWNRSIAYFVDPASSRTCSPQIADLTRTPAPRR